MKIFATLPASDLERAKAWYKDVLDLDPVETAEDGAHWYELDGTRFLLYGSQFAGSNQATAAGFVVDDVAETVAALRARGAVMEEYDFGDDFRTVDGIMTLPSGTKTAWFKDSEGNILGISTQ